MEIPKKIEKLLDRRQRLAEDLITIECELDAWLEGKGADLLDIDISDAVMSGCLIYCEPATAKAKVKAYIKDNL